MTKSIIRRVLSAGEILNDLNLFGMIWTDENLCVRSKFGKLASTIQLNQPLTDSVIALAGLENEILELADSKGETIELPSVAIYDGTNESTKANFTVVWDHEQNGALVLVYRSNAQSEIQVELSRQLRARLMAETQKEQVLQELARANDDLEQFAAIISHDLKAPLRHMTYLVDEAYHQCESSNIEATTSKIRMIGEQARGMSRMLTSLFEYSTIGKKYDVMETFSLHQLVTDIVNHTPLNGKSVNLQGGLPTITTLRAPLALVIQNLIANAIQHHDRATGETSVRCDETPDTIIIRISDDGPGIHPRHHKTIFLPFRQIRNRETDGNNASGGMGLAMVSKTITAIGGEIRIKSDPDQRRGTEFKVIWPRLTN